MIQIAKVKKPTSSFERDCSVYGCDNKSILVLEIGGGSDEGHTHVTSCSLCYAHYNNLLESMSTFKEIKMDSIDIVFSIDLTSSMFPAAATVRRNCVKLIPTLFSEIPNLRVGVIGHGDYCDKEDCLQILDITNNQDEIIKFFNLRQTNGGCIPECYELAMYKARNMSWTGGKNKALVLLGDSEPHPPEFGKHDANARWCLKKWANGIDSLNWQNELQLLKDLGVQVLPIQCLGYRRSDYFYEHIANLFGSYKLTLEQFNEVSDLITGICLARADKLFRFDKLVEVSGYNLQRNLDVLRGRKPTAKRDKTLDAVHPSRFQIMHVDKDCKISDFVRDNGCLFKKGKGFYEFTKRETIQYYKEVVLRSKKTGEMFSGDAAKIRAGIEVGRTGRFSPKALEDYEVYCQSTSNNRKLIAGTKFLYEVLNFHE